ncbi:MAG: chemotaxis protein CheA, partial [Clostridiales bacterium]|nr:chemotaxis protein CheA [Clostridiales bacterium]
YYPVVRLHKVFGIETEITDISSGIVILVETHEKSFCIFADSLLGEQQVVVKSLPLYLNKYNVKETGITGCAILGDGSISLILDILNLYNNN